MSFKSLLRKPFVNLRWANPIDLSGKKIIVTGASPDSLGYETARALAAWGAEVIITTRHNSDRIAEQLKEALSVENKPAHVRGYSLDLADRDSVNSFVEWYQENCSDRLDVLVNNAGIHLDLLSKWKEPKLSQDNIEVHWRTNFLGSAQLTLALLPLMQKTGRTFGEARIVNVVSQLHTKGSNDALFDPASPYDSWKAYGMSKLALIHFSQEINRRYFESDHVQSYSVHPGGRSGAYTNVATKGLEGHAMIGKMREISAPIEKFIMATAEEGAQTQIFCASSPAAKSGYYYQNCEIAEASPDTLDQEAAAKVWQIASNWTCINRESPDDAVNQKRVMC